mmetsp:Transcript_12247/g.38377  ORF Transcript_12247/g.38377 Transcript_12247/m.38377 type:complete len:403 (-) Transcript_12247:295-1503(-)
MPEGAATANGGTRQQRAADAESSAEFVAFRRSYLAAFLCASGSDWLKGPYIYRLYEARGFAAHEITLLFATGYMSSAFFGLIAGMMTDALGRRRMCLCFCALYTLHCAMHALSSLWVLLLARAVSGVATALLFSAFEAWMVAEHGRRFPGGDLAKVFALQTQGNALVAVAAGTVAQGAVWIAGYAAPFAVALPLLAYCSYEVCKWPENVGNGQGNLRAVAKSALATMDTVVARVGMLQCIFEASMHVFVFLWTPCLQRGGLRVPHGLIFSLYMLCMMLGGRACSSGLRPSLGLVFAISACCLMVPSVSEALWCNLAAFCCFECCVGCYFPQIAFLRSQHLREESRSATMTLFRVPFNCIVVAVLIWGRSSPPQVLLGCASCALLLGAAMHRTLPPEAARKAQ